MGTGKDTVYMRSTSRLRGDNPVRPDPTHDRSVFTVLFVYTRVKIASTCVSRYGGVRSGFERHWQR